MINLLELLNRARYILKTDSLSGLIRRSLTYLILEFGTYYLYEQKLIDRDEADFLPKLSNIECKIIHSNQEADQLVPEYDDFRRVIFNARRMLDNSGIAICLYKGPDLAHISWLALNENAKKSIDALPYVVNFSEKLACTGGTFTDSRYRGKNLMAYGNYKKFAYLKQIGISGVRYAIETDNIESLKGYTKFNPILYAKATYCRFLKFCYWKETPIDNPEPLSLF